MHDCLPAGSQNSHLAPSRERTADSARRVTETSTQHVIVVCSYDLLGSSPPAFVSGMIPCPRSWKMAKVSWQFMPPGANHSSRCRDCLAAKSQRSGRTPERHKTSGQATAALRYQAHRRKLELRHCTPPNHARQGLTRFRVSPPVPFGHNWGLLLWPRMQLDLGCRTTAWSQTASLPCSSIPPTAPATPSISVGSTAESGSQIMLAR